MRPVLLALVFAGACKKPEPGTPDDPLVQTGVPEPIARNVGPGLGNLAYDASELFAPIAFVDTDSGVPTSVSPLRQFKPFGTNVAAMHSGWMVTLFASDSGLAGGGLLVYDVSDPRAPVLAHREFALHADGREEAVTDVPVAESFDGATGAFREQHAIGWSHQEGRDLALFHTATGIEIWDLTDPLAPAPFSRLDLPGVEGGDYVKVAWQASWQGGWAYVAGSEHGIWVVDTRDPANPVLADRGGLPNPIPPGELGGFRVGPIFALGTQLVLSSMDTSGGYGVLDVSDPAHPTLLSAVTAGFEKFYSTCFTGDRIVGSERGGEARMWVHDLSDPFDPRPVGTHPEIPEQLYCGSQDGFVFQGNEHDIAKVDVSGPAFEVVGTGHIDRDNVDHGQVTPFGNLVFVGNDHGTGSALMPHQREPDTTPPAVVAVRPDDGAVHVAPTARIGLAFTDAIDNLTLTAENLEIREVGGAVVPGVFAQQGHLVNFTPSAELTRGASYAVTVHPGLQDWAGNGATAFTSTFTVTDLAGGGGLTVALDPIPSVAVGTELALSAAVTGDAELAWRFEDGGPWTPFGPETATTHTWTAPGHHTVFVRATDGARTAVDSARITVHRPIAGPVALASTVALDEARGTAWVANRDQGTVSAVDLVSLAVAEHPVGDTPTGVAIDATGSAWLPLMGEDRLARVSPAGAVDRYDLPHGDAPCAVVADAAGTSLLVSASGPGDVVRIDAITGTELDRVAVGPSVCGLSRAPDGTLWVAEARGTEAGGFVHEVALDPLAVQRTAVLPVDATTVDAEDRGRGVPGLLGAPGLSPDGIAGWIPASQANIARGAYRDGQPLTHESSVRAVLPELDLGTASEVPGTRLDLNDRAGPSSIVTSPLGDVVFVALMGSNEVAIVDAYSGATLGAIARPGAAPRGLALSADGTALYVHAWLDRELAIYDVSGVLDGSSFSPPELGRVALVATEALAPLPLLGKRIFHDASDPRMSADGYLSCASCHPDGGHDGLTWDFTDRGEGLRNTTDLRGRGGMGHGPVHWTANFDEIQDFENDIRGAFGGAGFLSDADFNAGTRSDPLGDPKAGLSPELDALAAYVATLDRFPASPHRNPDGSTTDAALRGELLFAGLGCDGCHTGPTLTDSGSDLHDVGTLTPASGQRRGGPLTGLDTPTLRGLWDGGPWLHDGGATSLLEVLIDRNTGAHGDLSALSPADLADLEAYLLELE